MLVNDDAHRCQGAEGARRFYPIAVDWYARYWTMPIARWWPATSPTAGLPYVAGKRRWRRKAPRGQGLRLDRVPEQFAMAPPDADSNDCAIAALVGDHVPGAAFDLDVDAIR